jgi:Ulp1 family protease
LKAHKWDITQIPRNELIQPRIALEQLLKNSDNKDIKLGHVQELNYDLTLRSLSTLLPSNWLNEEVVNAYFLLLSRVVCLKFYFIFIFSHFSHFSLSSIIP